MQIVAYLEQLVPQPALYPTDEARYAETLIFIDWFNRVWKLAPNRIEAELARRAARPHAHHAARRARWPRRSTASTRCSPGRKYLMGSELSAADIAAFPFLKYAAKREPADSEPFHEVLDDYQELTDEHFRLRSWIKRMDALPRA